MVILNEKECNASPVVGSDDRLKRRSARNQWSRVLDVSTTAHVGALLRAALQQFPHAHWNRLFKPLAAAVPEDYTQSQSIGTGGDMEPFGLLAPSDTGVSDDDARVAYYMQHSRAEATRRGWRSQWNNVLAFCERYSFEPFPTSWYTLVRLFSAMADAGYAYGTIEKYRGTIAVAHRFADLPDPTLDHRVQRVLAGIARVIGTENRERKEALLDAELLRMRDVAKKRRTLRSLLDWTVLSFAYGLKLRKSEVVIARIEHLRVDPVARKLVYTIPYTKTSQTAPQLAIAEAHDDERLCPVVAIQKWVNLNGRRSGPLFLVPKGHMFTDKALSPGQYERIVKDYTAEIGLDPDDFGTHSLRAGNITQALLNHERDVDVAISARHRDLNNLLKYYRPRLDARYATKELWNVE